MRTLWPLLALVGIAPGCATVAESAPRKGGESAAALAKGDNARALALAREGLEATPNNPWLHYDEGCALAGLGRVDDALAALSAAEREFVDDHFRSLAVFRRALALQAAGRCDEATHEYERYQAILGGNDSDSVALAARNESLCRVAAPAYGAGARPRESPVSVTPPPPPLGNRVVSAIVAGDHARALLLANEGLRENPRDPWLVFNRGIALLNLDRLDEGIAALDEAERGLATPQEKAGVVFRRARANDQAGRCARAVRDYERYVSLIRDIDEAGAALALRYARSCPVPRPWEVTKAPRSSPSPR